MNDFAHLIIKSAQFSEDGLCCRCAVVCRRDIVEVDDIFGYDWGAQASLLACSRKLSELACPFRLPAETPAVCDSMFVGR